MTQPLMLALAGVLVGAVGTLVGTGGGWAIVPMLLFLLRLSSPEAAATSLFAVLANAASGSVAYARQKRILYQPALVFALATFPGAWAAAQLLPRLDAQLFTRFFAAFLILVALFLAVGRDAMARKQHGHTPELRAGQLALGVVVSLGVGFVSSLLGVGGGIIHVPFLILVLGLPAHSATATSHLVLALTSLVGVSTYAWEGYVVWPVALPLAVGAVVGAQLGARFSSVLPSRVIQRVLAVLLGVFAVILLMR